MISRPLKSPIQYLQKEQADKALMVRMMADLLKVHNEFVAKHEELKKLVTAPLKKGDKGDRGERGSDAKMKGDKGEKGDKPTKEELVEIIKPLIPEVKDRKAIITDEHIDRIAERAAKKVKAPKIYEIDPLSIIDKIMALPEGKRLSTRHIDGLEQTMRAFDSQLKRGYLHGGGISSLQAGSGITLVKNSDGSYTITSTGGSASITAEELTGAQSGNNVTATLSGTPVAFMGAYKNGQKLRVNIGYTRVGTAITFLNADAGGDYFDAVYST